MLFLGFLILAIVGTFIFFTIPEMVKDAKEWYKLYFAKSDEGTISDERQELKTLIELREANESVFNNTIDPKVIDITCYRDIAYKREIDNLVKSKAVKQIKRMAR